MADYPGNPCHPWLSVAVGPMTARNNPRCSRSRVSSRPASFSLPSPGSRVSVGSLIVNCVPRPGSLWTMICSAVGLDDLPRRGQSQAGAAGLGGEEGVEDLGQRLLVHAAAGVDQVQRHAVGGVVGADDELPAVGHRLLGVEHQVQAAPRGTPRGPTAPWADRRRDNRSPRSALPGPWAGRSPAPARTCIVQVGRLELQPLDLGEVEEVVQQVLQPLALPLHHLHLRQRPAVAGRFGSARSPRPASSMFSRIVDSGFLISWASPPASRAISVY